MTALQSTQQSLAIQLTGSGQNRIEYCLKYSKRRSIGLMINGQGLHVTAPIHSTHHQIETLLIQKQNWILKKLQQRHNLKQHNIPASHILQDGAVLPFLGKTIAIRLHVGASKKVYLDPVSRYLIIKANPNDRALIEKYLNHWLQTQARYEFTERIERLRPHIGVALNSWGLSSAASRWGSCSAQCSIRLHWRLVHYPEPIIDYVVAHEMAHLIEFNHSKRFWDKVSQLCPNYLDAKKILAHHQPNSIPVFSEDMLM